MSKLRGETDWLRANIVAAPVGVDRKANVLRGFVVAEEGDFKTPGRGSFDVKSLETIVELANKEPAGLKSRLGHPTLSADGLGKLLGRAKNHRLDEVLRDVGGEKKRVPAVRADLHFDKTALDEPIGGGKPLGLYVMDLAESDPGAFSSSLVLKTNKEQRLDADGKPAKDAAGKPLAPLWRPLVLHATDVVDTGDAVGALLSVDALSADGLNVEGLPDELVRRTCELLDRAFPDADRETIKARIDAWQARYLAWRFGDELAADGVPETHDPAAAKSSIANRRRLLELVHGDA